MAIPALLEVEILEGSGFKHEGSHMVEARVDGFPPQRTEWATDDDYAFFSGGRTGKRFLSSGPHGCMQFNNVVYLQQMDRFVYFTLIHKRMFSDHKRCGEAFVKLAAPVEKSVSTAKLFTVALEHKMRFAGSLQVRISYSYLSRNGQAPRIERPTGGAAYASARTTTTSRVGASTSMAAPPRAGTTYAPRADGRVLSEEEATRREIEKALRADGGDLSAQAAMLNQFEQRKQASSPSASYHASSPSSHGRGSPASSPGGSSPGTTSPAMSPQMGTNVEQRARPRGPPPRDVAASGPKSTSSSSRVHYVHEPPPTPPDSPFRGPGFSSAGSSPVPPSAGGRVQPNGSSRHDQQSSSTSGRRGEPPPSNYGSSSTSNAHTNYSTTSRPQGATSTTSSAAAASKGRPPNTASASAPAGATRRATDPRPDPRPKSTGGGPTSASAGAKSNDNHQSQPPPKKKAAPPPPEPEIDPEEAKREKELEEKRKEIKMQARASQLAKVRAMSDTSSPSPATKSPSPVSPVQRRVIVEKVRSPDTVGAASSSVTASPSGKDVSSPDVSASGSPSAAAGGATTPAKAASSIDPNMKASSAGVNKKNSEAAGGDGAKEPQQQPAPDDETATGTTHQFRSAASKQASAPATASSSSGLPRSKASAASATTPPPAVVSTAPATTGARDPFDFEVPSEKGERLRKFLHTKRNSTSTRGPVAGPAANNPYNDAVYGHGQMMAPKTERYNPYNDAVYGHGQMMAPKTDQAAYGHGQMMAPKTDPAYGHGQMMAPKTDQESFSSSSSGGSPFSRVPGPGFAYSPFSSTLPPEGRVGIINAATGGTGTSRGYNNLHTAPRPPVNYMSSKEHVVQPPLYGYGNLHADAGPGGGSFQQAPHQGQHIYNLQPEDHVDTSVYNHHSGRPPAAEIADSQVERPGAAATATGAHGPFYNPPGVVGRVAGQERFFNGNMNNINAQNDYTSDNYGHARHPPAGVPNLIPSGATSATNFSSHYSQGGLSSFVMPADPYAGPPWAPAPSQFLSLHGPGFVAQGDLPTSALHFDHIPASHQHQAGRGRAAAQPMSVKIFPGQELHAPAAAPPTSETIVPRTIVEQREPNQTASRSTTVVRKDLEIKPKRLWNDDDPWTSSVILSEDEEDERAAQKFLGPSGQLQLSGKNNSAGLQWESFLGRINDDSSDGEAHWLDDEVEDFVGTKPLYATTNQETQIETALQVAKPGTAGRALRLNLGSSRSANNDATSTLPGKSRNPFAEVVELPGGSSSLLSSGGGRGSSTTTEMMMNSVAVEDTTSRGHYHRHHHHRLSSGQQTTFEDLKIQVQEILNAVAVVNRTSSTSGSFGKMPRQTETTTPKIADHDVHSRGQQNSIKLPSTKMKELQAPAAHVLSGTDLHLSLSIRQQMTFYDEDHARRPALWFDPDREQKLKLAAESERQKRFATLLRSVTLDQQAAPSVDVQAVLREHKEGAVLVVKTDATKEIIKTATCSSTAELMLNTNSTSGRSCGFSGGKILNGDVENSSNSSSPSSGDLLWMNGEKNDPKKINGATILSSSSSSSSASRTVEEQMASPPPPPPLEKGVNEKTAADSGEVKAPVNAGFSELLQFAAS
ncbi:unnamed protein product [Amoebophrya sp. A120]|nr:unnamed protein product [Amoebophrya sp. A120]|eukprot:GSA120T00011052001.1